MSTVECWARWIHISVVVTFLHFFPQAASKSMLTRLLEINTLLLQCMQMGSFPSSHHTGVPRSHDMLPPSLTNSIPQISKDWHEARLASLVLGTRSCPVFCFY